MFFGTHGNACCGREASTLEEINADNENGRVQKMTTIRSFVKAIFAGENGESGLKNFNNWSCVEP